MKTNVILINIFILCLCPLIIFAQTSKDIPSSSFGKAIGLVKSTSGKPAVDIEVHLSAVSGRSYSIIETTRTNSKGIWFISQVQPGRYAAWIISEKISRETTWQPRRVTNLEKVTGFLLKSIHFWN